MRKRRAPTKATIEVISLQSGSEGNSYYIEAGGVGILIDAGISGVRVTQRLQRLGKDIGKCRSLFISHDHRDHAQCAGIYHRKFGLPIHVTEPTWNAILCCWNIGKIAPTALRFIKRGDCVEVPTAAGPLRVHSFPTPHDGVDCLAFVVECDGKRLGILSDLGHSFPALRSIIRSLDGVIIESNYDPVMLRNGPYPLELQARIAGQGGHLSNEESAELVEWAVAGNRLQWAVLCHLSAENNTPRRAIDAHRAVVPKQFAVQVADRYEACGPWYV
ncbi:MAG: metal-dependent hydrolase [Pirellulaceae bacterium]|nr:MAG: metal-dependent hydrolase [Pirellulaceae bacterium]